MFQHLDFALFCLEGLRCASLGFGLYIIFYFALGKALDEPEGVVRRATINRRTSNYLTLQVDDSLLESHPRSLLKEAQR